MQLGLDGWRCSPPVGVRAVTTANERRLDALERTRCPDAVRPLPVVLPDTATDAELNTLRRHGVEAYRATDPAFLELFI